MSPTSKVFVDSSCDAASFALMEREGMTTAFAMDRHFAQYGKFVILDQGG